MAVVPSADGKGTTAGVEGESRIGRLGFGVDTSVEWSKPPVEGIVDTYSLIVRVAHHELVSVSATSMEEPDCKHEAVFDCDALVRAHFDPRSSFLDHVDLIHGALRGEGGATMATHSDESGLRLEITERVRRKTQSYILPLCRVKVDLKKSFAKLKAKLCRVGKSSESLFLVCMFVRSILDDCTISDLTHQLTASDKQCALLSSQLTELRRVYASFWVHSLVSLP